MDGDFVPIRFGRGGGGRPPGRGNNNNRGGGRGHRGGGGGRGFRGGGRFHNNNNGGRGRGGRGGGRGRGGRGGRGRGGGRGRMPFGNVQEIFEETGTPSETSVSIAVEGCGHGELDSIYDRIRMHEEKTGQTVDLLICCGDFQSIRHPVDFHSFAAPPKYRTLGTFCEYYSGAKTAPVLTLFVGGNHENSQQLQELYYGGWVAPNIYYLGAAGVVKFKGIRIGGISGIYKQQHYHLGHFERPPYNSSTLRSVYHVRILEVFRFQCLDKDRQRVDVMISHDWPQGIEQHGNTRYLLNKKPFFRSEVEQNCLGSPANHEILQVLRPKLWFSAHLHVGFRATVKFKNDDEAGSDTTSKKKATHLVPSQVIHGDGDGDESSPPIEQQQENIEVCQPVSTSEQIEQSTKFISLDKCLPGRQFLSIAHVEPPPSHTRDADNNNAQDMTTKTESEQTSPPGLEYDLEWLAILRKTHQLTEANQRRQEIPQDLMTVTSDELDWVQRKLESTSNGGGNPLAIPNNFTITVPPASANNPQHQQTQNLPRALPRMGNPQTDDFLKLLELEHIVTIPYDGGLGGGLAGNYNNNNPPVVNEKDDNEIDIDEVDAVVEDENEIDIGDGEDDGDDDGNGAEEEESDPKRPRIGST